MTTGRAGNAAVEAAEIQVFTSRVLHGVPENSFVTSTGKSAPVLAYIMPAKHNSSDSPVNAGGKNLAAGVKRTWHEASNYGIHSTGKTEAKVTLSNLITIYNGNPQEPTATTDPPDLKVDFTYEDFAGIPINAGNYEVEATIDDPNYEGSATGNFIIEKAQASIFLSDLRKSYTGEPQTPTIATEPEGLSVAVTYNGSDEKPVAVGDYAVDATVVDQNHSGSAKATFTITDNEATVTLSNLTTTYTGDPQYPTAVTDPPGLQVDLTFDGSSIAPTNAGSYAVIATINDPEYNSSDSGTFVIEKASATIILSDLEKAYTGDPQSPTFQTEPAGLGVDMFFNGSAEEPVEVGEYAVHAVINDPNYTGSAEDTFIITANEPKEAQVTLSNLITTYNGVAQSPTAATDPTGLNVEFTFDGSHTPPVNAGSYTVIATINDPDYTGSATETFIIEKANANVSLSDLSKPYNGKPQSPVVTTDPPDLSFTITYDGLPDPPSTIGSYAVEVAVTDPNYTGSASGTFTITNSEANVTLSELVKTYTGDQQSPTAITDPPGLQVDFTFDGQSSPPVNAGSYEVVATINDPHYAGSATATFVINPATASVLLENLLQNYDGLPKSVSATTDPRGLDVSVTYNGSSSPPSARGSYAVKADIANPNYTGSASGTLVINGAPTSSGIPDITVNEDAANYQINLHNHFDDAEDGSAGLIFRVQGNTNADLINSVEIREAKLLIISFAPNKNGSAELTVRATDKNGLYIDDQFSITVNQVQDVPVFVSIPVKGVLQGEKYIYKPEATDPDGDVLTYTNVFVPHWITFKDNGNGKGELTGVAGVGDIGNHMVTLEVSDNKGKRATQAFTIKVVQSNEPPVFSSTPVLEVNQDQTYRYNIKAKDTDDNKLIITAPNLPEWLTLTDNGNGTALLQGKANNSFTGDHQVTLRVTDIFEAYEEQKFTITVRNVNDAPTFVSDPVVIASQNQSYLYEVRTQDIDEGDNRTIYPKKLPVWLQLTDKRDGTATLSGNAPMGSSGSKHDVVLAVKDESGASATQTFTLRVNSPPDLKDISLMIKEDEQWAFSVNDFNLGYTDDDGHKIAKVKIESLPDGELTWFDEPIHTEGEVTVTDGEIQNLNFQPPLNESGKISFKWTAFDGFDWSEKSAIFNIEIQAVNDRPILTNLEVTPLAYSQNDPAVPVTETIIINDVDHSKMKGATVAIVENYDSEGDILSYDASNTNITGVFDKTNGVLILTGEDSKSNYESALSHVLFSNVTQVNTDIIEKVVSIAVTDGLESSDTVYRSIRIADFLPDLDIVNAFTPNNDEVNDYWNFVNLEFYSAIQITVFNTSGHEVFTCSQSDCTWDGSSNGRLLPAGSYFYTIDLNHGTKRYRGTVTILK